MSRGSGTASGRKGRLLKDHEVVEVVFTYRKPDKAVAQRPDLRGPTEIVVISKTCRCGRSRRVTGR
jgi:hypothetical protein